MTITMQKKLILASSSPRRQELIASLRLPFEIKVSDVSEDTEPGLSPAEVVEQLSSRKAAAVCEMYKEQQRNDGIVIGSDTIVVLNGEILGKPKDKADAFRMLNGLQGREHYVYSGVACIDLSTGKQIVSHQVTLVYMKPLTKTQIERYIDTGEPMDKAGSYGIQGLGATIVERIEGDYFNVVGLPVSLLSDLLQQFGIAVI
ncbi:Maf family protein [Paenibacillus sp. NPDC056579]|uniref:Maf family protein n=1 Tax=unclassified Paenibacillus TaxID=185978 RepID=UPI001EF971D2|nr:Maf family protein [Paenibacillus sp. H1-7]ULL17857.1 septum formation inhibitor Maf [Paenibacillus sp. H1-7]